MWTSQSILPLGILLSSKGANSEELFFNIYYTLGTLRDSSFACSTTLLFSDREAEVRVHNFHGAAWPEPTPLSSAPSLPNATDCKIHSSSCQSCLWNSSLTPPTAVRCRHLSVQRCLQINLSQPELPITPTPPAALPVRGFSTPQDAQARNQGISSASSPSHPITGSRVSLGVSLLLTVPKVPTRPPSPQSPFSTMSPASPQSKGGGQTRA